ncbi:DUF4167 domain-containing protein [Rhodobacterales bacterium HKCCSP123]|nr:DUF4167 domain-containing protein [Rhodobacterales bacterium HKCCSP123]
MRSSKNRSRSKGNRNRSVGNIVNRVFDSSGPEGKVRGTPQQIIDKYNQLARDAQLSNDRVAAENFQQHAEHYLRMLAEAQREQDARREQQQGQQGQQGGGGQRDQGDAQQGRFGGPEAGQGQPDGSDSRDGGRSSGFDTVMDSGSDGDSGLVETPETAPKPKRSRTRRPKKTDENKGGGDGGGGDSSGGDAPGTPPQEAAE